MVGLPCTPIDRLQPKNRKGYRPWYDTRLVLNLQKLASYFISNCKYHPPVHKQTRRGCFNKVHSQCAWHVSDSSVRRFLPDDFPFPRFVGYFLHERDLLVRKPQSRKVGSITHDFTTSFAVSFRS